MKQILTTIIALAIGIASYAQTEGIITYNMTLTGESISSPMASMLPKQVITYFKGKQSRADIEMMGGSMRTITNAETQMSTMLMDMMGKKMAIDMDQKALAAKNGSVNYVIEEMPETKLIAGYVCKKAIIKDKSHNTQADIYYTATLPILNTEAQYKNVKGCMLAYSMNMNGILVYLEAEKVEIKTIDKTTFDIPTGYERKSFEDATLGTK